MKTKFVNTLDEEINLKQNSIYTPVLKMAWEELKTTLNLPITKIESDIFNKVNDYKFLEEPLSSNEIKKEVTINEDKIKIKAEFDKSLPFKKELYVNGNPLFFEKKEICSFSPNKNWCKMLYYEDKDNFAINISTKNDNEEIILIKSDFNNNFNLQDEINSTLSKQKNNNVGINKEDTIIVPIIEVDSSSDYADLLPVQLFTDKYPFIIETLSQKIDFTLNNKGAEVKVRVILKGTLQCIFQILII